jgi:transcriptional regulator GlxA family with amidase domain
VEKSLCRQRGRSRASQNPIHFGVLVFSNFPLMAFSAAIEPLHAANRLGATPSYRWTTVSAFDRRVNASSGLQFMAEYLAAEAPGVDRIVVRSGGDADQFVSKALGSWLRREARRGAMIGAVADGAFFLTRIRFLSNRRSTGQVGRLIKNNFLISNSPPTSM